MTKLAILFSAAAMALGVLLHAGAAGATPTLARTWVSGTIGSDSNPCTRAAPCATFQAAYNATIAGGEIDVLDGGEFGNVNIFKAITIANDGSGTAAITSSGTGIFISVGASDAVVLRGLSINGISAGGGFDGIDFLDGGSLLVDHCKIQGFRSSSGIDVDTIESVKLWVKDTVLSGSGGSAAVWIRPPGGSSVVALERVQILNAIGNGVRVDGSFGVAADVELHDVTVDAATGTGIVAVSQTSGGPTVNVLADHVTVAHGPGYGFKASGGTAIVYLRGSVAEDNGVGLGASAGGQIFSYGDNSVANNTGGAGVTPTAIPVE
jgi:hypothetical protein